MTELNNNSGSDSSSGGDSGSASNNSKGPWDSYIADTANLDRTYNLSCALLWYVHTHE